MARAGMLTMDSNTVITSTEAGVLMAAHCLDFETMRLIIKVINKYISQICIFPGNAKHYMPNCLNINRTMSFIYPF